MSTTTPKPRLIPKVAVLVAGAAAGILAVVAHPAPASAFPNYASTCTACHSAGGSVSAVPSSATVAPGATYSVAMTFVGGNGNSGYWISNTSNDPVSIVGPPASGASRTQSMTAPTTPGSYTYTVWMRQGVASSSTYTITVAAPPPPAPSPVTTSTALSVTPASPAQAPASLTLRATVSGAGAAGTVEFFDGTTSLGAPAAVSGGVVTKALSGLGEGTYAYQAVFTPTDPAAFTSSTSSVLTYVVTAPPAPSPVTTSTALSVTPASPAQAPASLTLRATVSGAGAAGTVEFFDGTTSLGAPAAVSGGVVTKALSGLGEEPTPTRRCSPRPTRRPSPRAPRRSSPTS